MRDQATGVFYEKDTRAKTTARNMIRMVQTVNANAISRRAHQLRHAIGSQSAGRFAAGRDDTPEQIAAAAAQAAPAEPAHHHREAELRHHRARVLPAVHRRRARPDSLGPGAVPMQDRRSTMC